MSRAYWLNKLTYGDVRDFLENLEKRYWKEYVDEGGYGYKEKCEKREKVDKCVEEYFKLREKLRDLCIKHRYNMHYTESHANGMWEFRVFLHDTCLGGVMIAMERQTCSAYVCNPSSWETQTTCKRMSDIAGIVYSEHRFFIHGGHLYAKWTETGVYTRGIHEGRVNRRASQECVKPAYCGYMDFITRVC